MAESALIKARLMDEEDMIRSMPPQKHSGMSEDKGPAKEEFMANKFAKGGMINKDVSMNKAEEDQVVHPAGLESDDDQMSPAKDEYMAAHFAKGGMISDEEEMEHHDSIAAAIMAKRRRMAEGGMVDIDSNAEEQPNQMDKLNRAALKENYDSDMDSIHEPMDSIGDSREDETENKLDMVSAIRRKMKSVR